MSKRRSVWGPISGPDVPLWLEDDVHYEGLVVESTMAVMETATQTASVGMVRFCIRCVRCVLFRGSVWGRDVCACVGVPHSCDRG